MIYTSTDLHSQPNVHLCCVEIVSNLSGDTLLELTAAAAEGIAEQLLRHANVIRSSNNGINVL